MVFDNVFGFAGRGMGIFSVNRGGARPQPGAGVDFEDSGEGTYDDTSSSLFTSAVHGASDRAKVVREQSPEARVVLEFLGAFVQNTQAAAGQQAEYAQDPASVSKAAAAGMHESSPTITGHSGLQMPEDLADPPRKSDFTKAPAPPKPSADTPKADAPQADKPKADKPTADRPSAK
jgi:hypothetical protein